MLGAEFLVTVVACEYCFCFSFTELTLWHNLLHISMDYKHNLQVNYSPLDKFSIREDSRSLIVKYGMYQGDIIFFLKKMFFLF